MVANARVDRAWPPYEDGALAGGIALFLLHHDTRLGGAPLLCRDGFGDRTNATAGAITEFALAARSLAVGSGHPVLLSELVRGAGAYPALSRLKGGRTVVIRTSEALPKKVKTTVHHILAPRTTASDMVHNHVILKAISAALVTAHSRTNLAAP